MPRTFRQFLEANRATICENVFGGEGQFPGIVDEVIRASKTERGAEIPLCDPDSIIDAVARAASWPVSIGYADGAALVVTDEIVPASGRPRLVAMLTARAELQILSRFGGLRWYNARCVYTGEADTFRPKQGDDPRIENHDDLTHDPKRRGTLCGVYVIGLQKHGLPKVLELMNQYQVDQLRGKWSRDLREGNLEDMEYFEQYCIAKCVHRFADRLVGLSDQVRGWLSDAPPRRKDAEPSVTVPVSDPRAVLDEAERRGDLILPQAVTKALIDEVAKEPPSRSTRQPREFASL